ncbi:Uncharacterised protein g11117 [Pycnogonum litorale]
MHHCLRSISPYILECDFGTSSLSRSSSPIISFKTRLFKYFFRGFLENISEARPKAIRFAGLERRFKMGRENRQTSENIQAPSCLDKFPEPANTAGYITRT